MAHLPITLNEVLSVFATLKVNRNVDESPCICPPKPPASVTSPTRGKTTSTGKHLRLLNGIALLLVTERTSDVAAVTLSTSVHQQHAFTVFHVIKNRECTATEKSYYSIFVKMINNPKNNRIPQLAEDLTDLVIQNCRPKILSRAVKLHQAFKEWKAICPEWDDATRSMKDDVAKFEELFKFSKSWPDRLDYFFETTLNPQHLSSASMTGKRLLYLSYEFSRYESFLKALGSPKLIRRIKKLAAYYQAVKTIAKQALRNNDKREFAIEIVSTGILPSESCTSRDIGCSNIVTASATQTCRFATNGVTAQSCQSLSRSDATAAR
jgi:hypothetical protein